MEKYTINSRYIEGIASKTRSENRSKITNTHKRIIQHSQENVRTQKIYKGGVDTEEKNKGIVT